jgi:hypothetical protein
MSHSQSRSRSLWHWKALALLCSASCSAVEPEAPGPLLQGRSEVVYGTDNRQDVYAHPDATLRARAEQSTVAVMIPTALNTTNPDNITFTTPTLRARRNLCETERFLDDPTSGGCSGTLIDDDLVLTAGHCFATNQSCGSARIVFNYYRTSADTLRTVTLADVFTCASVVVKRQSSSDYAIVKLDRPATPRFTPAPVSVGNRALAAGQRVAVIGTPSSIPFKIESGGTVRDPRAGNLDYFVANTDTFAGNSGSGVYELGGYTQVGILVRGDTDYVPNGTCNVVNTCPETGCRGEDSTYVYPAIDALCRTTDNASPRLCGNRTADFNNDSNLDVLWHNGAEDKSAIWLMREGELQSEVVNEGTSDVRWRPVSTGDFDSDGHLDLLRHHRTRGEVSLWLMREGTVLSRTVLQGPTDVNWYPVTARDFDSDGNLDLLWHHRTQGQLAIWFMRAGAKLSEAVLQGQGGVNWYPVTAGDFNGDGDLDVLWHHRTGGQLALWFMSGGAVLSRTVLPGPGNVNWSPVTAGDFNGDGDLDVLWHHRTGGQVALWFMRAGALLSSVTLQGYPDVNWRPVSSGDLDGDGGMDLLWHHRTRGLLGLWFMKHGAVRSTVVRPGPSGESWYLVR